MTTGEWKNKLYYGDNLVWLRDHEYFPSRSIDLVYLDPPFNSKEDYNVIFMETGGETRSQAQIRAFDDTWQWDRGASAQAISELGSILPEVAEFISWLGRQLDNTSQSLAAYLSMMAVRLVELHRVLKPTGALYLHCDPTASHYLKLVLDRIFGATKFRNELVWKRSTAHSDIGQGAKHMGRLHDIILFYSKSDDFTCNMQFTPYSQEYVDTFYRHEEPSTGRRYTLDNIAGPGGAAKGNPKYEFLGVTRYWRYSKKRMQELYEQGRIIQTKPGAIPRYKRYLDEMPGVPLQDIWDDILPIGAQAKERLGYPTQKPLPLLERIIEYSSNDGDIVLDPFCGCGTTVVAAHKFNRRWCGIDVTWLAIDKVEQRLRETYGEQIRDTYLIEGMPYDLSSAQALANKNKKEFEIWALSLVGAAPREQDGGVDGLFGFVEKDRDIKRVIVQVKGGQNLNPSMVRDLIGTVENEGAAIGLLITLKIPTPGMIGLAAHAGTYYSALWDKAFSRIQIRTIGELLEGNGFDLPTVGSPMKKATRIIERGRTKRML